MVSRVIEDEAIIVPIRHNAREIEYLYSLNAVGAYIWELIDGKTKMEEIKKEVISTFEVESEQADNDLKEFIEQLETIKAIKQTE